MKRKTKQRSPLFPEGCHKNSNNANENGSTNGFQNKRTGKLVSGAPGINQDWSRDQGAGFQWMERRSGRGFGFEIPWTLLKRFQGFFIES